MKLTVFSVWYSRFWESGHLSWDICSWNKTIQIIFYNTMQLIVQYSEYTIVYTKITSTMCESGDKLNYIKVGTKSELKIVFTTCAGFFGIFTRHKRLWSLIKH